MNKIMRWLAVALFIFASIYWLQENSDNWFQEDSYNLRMRNKVDHIVCYSGGVPFYEVTFPGGHWSSGGTGIRILNDDGSGIWLIDSCMITRTIKISGER